MSRVKYPITLPGEGPAGVTGYWRWQKPIINLSKCNRCGLCWLYCPDVSITLDGDGYPHVNYTYCKGCGICARECPMKAIEVVDEWAREEKS